MGCGSCSTAGGCSPKGCKNNGTCGTSGCNKLNVYDWLQDVVLPEDYAPFNIVEIRFKGSRKEYFKNNTFLELYTGDAVVLETDFGHDIGHVSLKGELVRLQLKKNHIDENSGQLKAIIRKANEKDIEKYIEAKSREAKMLERARTLALQLKLEMKLSDIEIQGDNKKVIFFYTAESRVDFRELIKRYADEFKLRIEMRQIGYRQEASRLGGIGSCGRELCCSTWFTDYKIVNTTAAKFQNLSINMLKLSGQCGRLKCCLNFELDTYMEALDEFPKGKVVLNTEAGDAMMQKIDILKRLTWFTYFDNPTWICVPLSQVKEYLALNAKGQRAPELIPIVEEKEIKPNAFEDKHIELVDDDLSKFDKKPKKKSNNNKKKHFKKKSN